MEWCIYVCLNNLCNDIIEYYNFFLGLDLLCVFVNFIKFSLIWICILLCVCGNFFFFNFCEIRLIKG